MVYLSEKNIKIQLQQMDPYEFEELIAEIWELQGYQTTVRQASGDRGVDIEARRQTPFSQEVLIQTKRYTDGNKIGSGEVRNYATLYQQVPEADVVVIVTSSDFTKEAKKLAKDLNVKTTNGDEISTAIKENFDDITTFKDRNSADVDFKDKRDKEIKNKLLRKLHDRQRECTNLVVKWESLTGTNHELTIDYKMDTEDGTGREATFGPVTNDFEDGLDSMRYYSASHNEIFWKGDDKYFKMINIKPEYETLEYNISDDINFIEEAIRITSSRLRYIFWIK